MAVMVRTASYTMAFPMVCPVLPLRMASATTAYMLSLAGLSEAPSMPKMRSSLTCRRKPQHIRRSAQMRAVIVHAQRGVSQGAGTRVTTAGLGLQGMVVEPGHLRRAPCMQRPGCQMH